MDFLYLGNLFQVKKRITRIERMIIGGGGAIVLALVMNMMK